MGTVMFIVMKSCIDISSFFYINSVLLSFYTLATVFQLYQGGDMMYAVRTR